MIFLMNFEHVAAKLQRYTLLGGEIDGNLGLADEIQYNCRGVVNCGSPIKMLAEKSMYLPWLICKLIITI